MIGLFSIPEELSLPDIATHNLQKRFQTVAFYVRVFAMYVIPIALTPLLRSKSPESRCAFVMLHVLFLWLFQSIPPAVASLLPLILIPTFLNYSVEQLLDHYTSETMMMYIGYAMLLDAIEGSNLHKRLILTLLLVLGAKTGFIVGGFVMTAVLMSLWTNAVRTAAVLLPIAMEAIQHIQDNKLLHLLMVRTKHVRTRGVVSTPIMEARYLIEGGIIIPDVISILQEFFTVRKSLLIGICYSAVLGNVGSVVGCGANLFIKAFMEEIYGYRLLTIYNWFTFHMPLTIFCTLLLWVVLGICYSSDILSGEHISRKAFEDVIYRHLEELGPITRPEVGTLSVISVLGVILVFIHFNADIADAAESQAIIQENASVFIAFLTLYSIPEPSQEQLNDQQLRRRAWTFAVQDSMKRISWAFLITMGAGICITHLIITFDLLKEFAGVIPKRLRESAFGLQVVVACAALVMAEINSSLNNIVVFAPFIGFASDVAQVHPMYLFMPFIFCSNFGFLLPTATPVSEYVADFADLQDDEFLLPGLAMKIGCTSLVILAYNTWCWDLFSLRYRPPIVFHFNRTTDRTGPNESH